jgi:glyoxylase-like metal-dependent hydrolase (beta-lactamase superfamily II)
MDLLRSYTQGVKHVNSRPFREVAWISEHVLKIAIPTPTLPPSFETNTYVIRCSGSALLVDAGSRDPAVLEDLVAVLAREGVVHVQGLVATHYHRDHTQGLPYLQKMFQAPIYIHPADEHAARPEMVGAVDVRPSLPAYDLDGLQVTIQHQPGHTHGHIHVLVPEDGVLLVGDHMAGDGSVWIGPPDGHMASYYEALQSIAQSGCHIAGPGHGPTITNAPEAATALLARRQGREREIVELLASGPRTLTEIMDAIYRGNIPDAAMWVARKTVQAHLQHLLDLNRIRRSYTPDRGFTYRIVSD